MERCPAWRLWRAAGSRWNSGAANRVRYKKRQSPDADKAGKQEADMRKHGVFERTRMQQRN
jgi:hypothetical protein